MKRRLGDSDGPRGGCQLQQRNSRRHVLSSLNKLDVDPRGLRGSRVTFTPDNHFRTQGSYKVYRWDSQTEQITVVSDWDAVDIVPRPD